MPFEWQFVFLVPFLKIKTIFCENTSIFRAFWILGIENLLPTRGKTTFLIKIRLHLIYITKKKNMFMNRMSKINHLAVICWLNTISTPMIFVQIPWYFPKDTYQMRTNHDILHSTLIGRHNPNRNAVVAS